MSVMFARSSVYGVLLALLVSPLHAATMLHNVVGYTSSDSGMQQFSVLVFDDTGKVIAAGDEALWETAQADTRIDGRGLTMHQHH